MSGAGRSRDDWYLMIALAGKRGWTRPPEGGWKVLESRLAAIVRDSARSDEMRKVREVVDALPDRIRLILTSRFDIDGAGRNPKSLDELIQIVAAHEGRGTDRWAPHLRERPLTRERVRQLEVEGLVALRVMHAI